MKTTEIKTLVEKASQNVPLIWPLNSFIASNPLRDFENMPFEKALDVAESLDHSSLLAEETSSIKKVNYQLIKWCQGYLDQGHAKIQMPLKDLSFYECFLKLAPYDEALSKDKKKFKHFFKLLPAKAEDALLMLMQMLSVKASEYENFLKEQFSLLPGWAGYIKRMQNWPLKDEKVSVDLVQFITVRLALLVLSDQFTALDLNPAKYDLSKLRQMEKKEAIYKKELLSKLHLNSSKESQRADAQLVFCIDVRSEPMRAIIEKVGNYQTYGFAGFFGVAVNIKKQFEKNSTSSCPVLIKPNLEIAQKPDNPHCQDYKKHQTAYHFFSKLREMYKSVKYNLATPLALAETLGLFCGLRMLTQALLPRTAQKAKDKILSKLAPKYQSTLEFNDLEASLEDKTNIAENALRGMNLTENFAPFVVFCGHGSTTENNPYASSLQCGACGGREGKENAEILATILNNSKVRAELKLRNIFIDDSTYFLFAQHDTTTNCLNLFEPKNLPYKLQKAYENFKRDINKVNSSKGLKAQALAELKSTRWSEVRPEWGLAKNASFIIGKRSLTSNSDLKARSFLHTYDWEKDTEGKILETILTAPLVVAQWINAQYLFSTKYPHIFGSGNKITHNVVGKIGVMHGNLSDLKFGLPLQSTHQTDHAPYHEPLRLLAVVEAPYKRVEEIINKHENLQQLFYNEWIKGVVLDPQKGIIEIKKPQAKKKSSSKKTALAGS